MTKSKGDRQEWVRERCTGSGRRGKLVEKKDLVGEFIIKLVEFIIKLGEFIIKLVEFRPGPWTGGLRQTAAAEWLGEDVADSEADPGVESKDSKEQDQEARDDFAEAFMSFFSCGLSLLWSSLKRSFIHSSDLN